MPKLDVEWDAPFTIVNDSIVYVENVYAPDCVIDGDPILYISAPEWEPLSYWSGQYSYAGPIMHPSEYIGIRQWQELAELAEDYLAYVMTTVRSDDPEDDEPAGWIVLGMPR